MSFITKRERVFNEYCDPFDLPCRNEGKLKAYASCTDARAWSHFCSDKTEHLVEIIKKNNEVARGKYVPTNVLIEMMMASKNAEIARLKRKMQQFEQMIAVYDQLELSCEQKCEITTAHAMIKAANKSMDDLALDLDVSGFTEGIDSDGFHTGKSGGDEASVKFKGDEWTPRSDVRGKESKINQVDLSCNCDASTSAYDVRIDELQEALIGKDAKLNAMQNTMAVMENDVCEPYCVYAHFYTALEKIFATLRQNEKYRIYLDLMSTSKDTRRMDIKGKILFKLKVLEKFSVALLAPCSERFRHDETCECQSAQVLHVETTFALTSAESKRPEMEKNKRAYLVADIMEHDEMKEILSKQSGVNLDEEEQTEDNFGVDNYSIDTENLNRLKSLQVNYDDLMTCYEDVKHERDNLRIKCEKYDELEEELQNMRSQLKEYSVLYNEREYYRKRSEDLDSLKEQYIVLTDETSGLEAQLKAEAEINNMKTHTVEDLRNENIELERKLNDALIAFEKEKNSLQCKLKETECNVMCQDQQIRSLSSQIDRLLEQDHDKHHDNIPKSVMILDEIEALKDQIKHLQESLYNTEDEKQQLQAQFEDKLKLISDLRMEIDDWKSTCEKTLQRNEYLERYTESFRDEVRGLVEENRTLSQDVEEKTTAVANLMTVINNKSQEINKLVDDIESRKKQNKDLHDELKQVKEKYGSNLTELENEKKQVLDSLQLARQESRELLEKVKDYDDVLHKREEISKSLETQLEDYNELKNVLLNTIEENKRLQSDLTSLENNNSILLQEIRNLREVNNLAVENISSLQNENYKYKLSNELTRKESEILGDKLKQFEDLREHLQKMRDSHEKLMEVKNKLENELQKKAKDLDDAIHSVELTKKDSEHLLEKIQQSENLKEDMIKLSKDYQKLVNEKQTLQKDLIDKSKELDNLLQSLTNLKEENEDLMQKFKKADSLENELAELKKAYDDLTKEKSILQADYDNKTEEINHLYNTLEDKIDENRDLVDQIKSLQYHQAEAKSNIEKLKDENLNNQSALNTARKESEELVNKIKNYEALLREYEDLKRVHYQIEKEKDKLQRENLELNVQTQNVMAQNEDLEKALINTRNELMKSTTENPYANVAKEIEEMKNEKLANHKKIRELLDKLDESENVISDLSEDIIARDDKIAILENHINSLEDEVRRLHSSLAEVVNAGQEIKDNSYQKIDQTLNKMEAHHSKATHNMKIELAKLQNQNARLEEQLSVTKIKSDESLREKHKYVSQIIHLQNEREIIVTDIKQLELSSVGDSNLSPDSNVEDILRSLEKIQKCLDAKNSKSNSLEKTLLKVQTSSQLLLSKADEAKKLVEKEKQKIINEKEEAIADKQNMEKQLLDLKVQLEQQTNHDQNIIKHLQAEILNQELIIAKINSSRQDYITKLEEEMRTLQGLYENSLTKISELQEKVRNLSEENDKNISIIDKINGDLTEKSKEISALRNSLDLLKNKSLKEVGIQAGKSDNLTRKNNKSQTDESHLYELGIKDNDESRNISRFRVNMPPQSETISDYLPNDMPQSINEVQILTVNVEPTFDFVKSSYVDYKIKRLSPGKLETYSISCIDSNIQVTPLIDEIFASDDKSDKSPTDSASQNQHLVDIFNRQSMHTSSSKAMEQPQTAAKISGFAGFGLANDISYSGSHLNNKPDDSITFTVTTPDKSTEKDLFLIYHDSESSQIEKDRWLSSDQPQLVKSTQAEKGTHAEIESHEESLLDKVGQTKGVLRAQTVVKQNKEGNIAVKQQQKSRHKPEKIYFEDSNQSRSKHQLQITLPRVDSQGYSNETIPTAGNQSIDSYESTVYSSQKQISHQDTDDAIQGSQEDKSTSTSNKTGPKNQDSSLLGSDSHHKLSRVEAEFLLFKEQNEIKKSLTRPTQDVKDFGLEYILDTVKREFSPDDNKNDKKLRKSRSDDVYNQMKESYNSNTKHSLPTTSIDGKTTTNSSPSPSKWSEQSHSRSVAEQSVMVNIDAPDYYESKMTRLSHLLENTEKDYKKKLDAIKMQYDNNIKSIINEHNHGVKSIQSLHEETLQDIIKIHENEVESLRTMSIEAMRKAEKLEKENLLLKGKMQDCSCVGLDEVSDNNTPDVKRRRQKSRGYTKMLTKTNVEAFNVKPKVKVHGPCTCSLDINVSDTIRNIFEQVDVEQRKLAEHAYLKYIANKIINGSVEALDAQELSFLHLKVCRTWKNKLTKEEAMQKKIDTLESELLNKQRNEQQHIADLDRKVAEERRRLQEVREAVCRKYPMRASPTESHTTIRRLDSPTPITAPPPTSVDGVTCSCQSGTYFNLSERQSAGDLLPEYSGAGIQFRRLKSKPESRAVLARLDDEDRREKEKKLFDEPPTRLRRAHDRPPPRPTRK
ncbi:cytadherence high molecular weight protein 2-like [Pectinophora gossypiella]|uniref:cytadherence high molecular weight protein 2-like n=1 Tax=Pectinophora gossypiella TaxID=13191 RepID=UPI00214F1D81|nr:cytadherence high molecular weight protein 2-like [Pectinophora gossypiella]